MTPEEMRAWRERLGLTQEAAGDVLGVTSRAVAKWEANQAPIDKRTELATQRYEQKHLTMHGINGLPLLYTVHVNASSENDHVGDTYLVIARQDHEANKLVYAELGKPAKVTLTASAVAKAPSEARPRILGTVAEFSHSNRVKLVSTKTFRVPRGVEAGAVNLHGRHG